VARATKEVLIMKTTLVHHAGKGSERPTHHGVRRWVITLALLLLVALVGMVGVSVYVDWQLTHPDHKYPPRTPGAGLAYSNVQFKSAQGNVLLSGWFLPSGTSTRTVIIAHGYAQYRLEEGPSTPMARLLVQHGVNVLTFDFRGCGRSQGAMVTLGRDEQYDVLGAVAYLKQRFAGQHIEIGLLGISTGGTASLLAGSKDQADIRAIVTDSPMAQLYPYLVDHANIFTNLPAIPFNQVIAWLAPVVNGVDAHEVNAVAAVQRMPHTPLFFIAGTADDKIPYAGSVQLYHAAPSAHKQLWLVPGGGHTSSYKQQPRAYEQKVLAFFTRYLSA
jgi:alpha-beta hydrolase superfamily lysophospholipase